MRAASFWWTTRWLSLWKLYLVESEMGEPKVIPIPIGSMYAIYGNIYHQYHIAYIYIYHTWILWDMRNYNCWWSRWSWAARCFFRKHPDDHECSSFLMFYIYIYIVSFLVHPRMDEDDSWRSSASSRYLGMLSIGSTTWKSTTETSVVPISQMPGSFPTAPSIGSPMKMSLERAGSFVPTTACRKR